jgi:hypothetical protein
MAKATYAAIASLDGYVEVEEGRFGWATPEDELSAVVHVLEPPVGTSRYGRRMDETMVFWETASAEDDEPPVLVRRCRDLAGGREGRVLPNASDGIQREDVMNPC